MKRFLESGLTMVELTIAMALMSILGYAAYQYSDRMRIENTAITEDLQNMISHFGASKIITKDIHAAEGTFNFINLPDDEGLPFFILAKNELCKNDRCKRTFSLEIPAGKTQSKYFYLLVKKPLGPESMKFTIEPTFVYGNDNRYSAINWKVAEEDESISKTYRPESPWQKSRLLLVESEMEYYDCFTKTESVSPDGSCPLSCTPTGSCNYAVKRPLKFLGVVRDDERDLIYMPIKEAPTLLMNRYKICRPDATGSCKGIIDLSGGVESSKTYYEKLPYIPGGDNRTSLTPVEIVRYHLERPTPESPDHMIQLKRTPATIVANTLVFENSLILMSGLKVIEFSRVSVSNPTIEYKMNKVRARKSVK
jgi:prepilin-type N-terminal cleavage/methylation domain-containing protein